MSEWSITELMAVVMAREFRDGEIVVMGAVPALPMAACRLARATHAPRLEFIVGGSGTVSPEPPSLPLGSCGGDLAPAATTLPLPDVVLLEGRGDAFDVFCAGGLQIDAHGNCNLICVGSWDRPKLRGPGTVGLPFLPNTRRSILYTQSHSPRTLVERVDFVSGPGHPAGHDEARPYRKEGPSLVVTPLATFDFSSEGRMRIRTVHPGVRYDEVLAATGFEPAPGPEPGETPPPTDEELAILRSFDPAGILRR